MGILNEKCPPYFIPRAIYGATSFLCKLGCGIHYGIACLDKCRLGDCAVQGLREFRHWCCSFIERAATNCHQHAQWSSLKSMGKTILDKLCGELHRRKLSIRHEQAAPIDDFTREQLDLLGDLEADRKLARNKRERTFQGERGTNGLHGAIHSVHIPVKSDCEQFSVYQRQLYDGLRRLDQHLLQPREHNKSSYMHYQWAT